MTVADEIDTATGHAVDFNALEAIEERLLWLSTRMIDYANRRGDTEIKVGGHQASCASMASIMTGLWFAHIGGEDKVAVKPHAAPLYHAIKYLTGELDEGYLIRLRERGGLQAYPSRTKDPDVAYTRNLSDLIYRLRHTGATVTTRAEESDEVEPCFRYRHGCGPRVLGTGHPMI